MRAFATAILLGVTLQAAEPTRPGAVSSGNSNTVSGARDSFMPLLSANDRHVVFVSYAHNLVTNDNLARHLDVFVYDLVTLTSRYPVPYPPYWSYDSNRMARLVSINRNGTGGGNGDSGFASISSNGQWIAFASGASDLVVGDTNNAADIFVRDMLAGSTVLVSMDQTGAFPHNPQPTSARPFSSNPQISHDGRWIAFDSRATNLVSLEDTNGASDVFIRDMQSGITHLVSVDATGTQTANGRSELPKITPDGRYVVFVSMATNLTVPGPGTDAFGGEIYVRDLQLGVTRWISTSPPPPAGFFGSATEVAGHPSISDDGQFVAFIDGVQTMLYSVASNTLTRLGWEPPRGVGPQISADGRTVAFAGNLNNSMKQHLYVWRRDHGSNVLVSYSGRHFALSRDGNSICFLSDLAEPQNNEFAPKVEVQLYHRDLVSGATRLVSVGGSTPRELDLKPPALSSTGDIVLFDSPADIVPGDLNHANDVFLRDVDGEITHLVSHRFRATSSRTALGTSRLWPRSVSSNGSVVAVTSYDSDIINNDTNESVDLFVRDLAIGTFTGAKVGIPPRFPAAFPGPTNLIAAGPAVSGDGKFVAFNWIGNVFRENQSSQFLYRYDRLANTSAPVSLTMAGQIAVTVGSPGISTDGRLVTFSSSVNSGEFVGFGPDRNPGSDVFVRDMLAGAHVIEGRIGTNILVSVNYTGVGSGNGASSNAVMSPNGRWVAFQTAATDLLPPVNGGGVDDESPRGLYARDVTSTNTARFIGWSSNAVVVVRGEAVFAPDSEWIGFGTTNFEIHARSLLTNRHRFICFGCGNPSLSSQAQFVAYETTNTGARSQVLVKNTTTGVVKLLSASLHGAEGNGRSTAPGITPNGRFIAFQSTASDLVENDGNGFPDIFLADRVLGTRLLISINKSGSGSGDGPSSMPILSADGRALVFQSFASDLIEGDYNDTRDVFVVRLSEPDSDGDGMDDDFEVTYFGNLSRDGTGDFDGDGQSDLAEFKAGTNPTDDSSIFSVVTLTSQAGGEKTVLWSAAPGRTYRVQYKDNLNGNWVDLPGQVTATMSTASKSDVTGANAPRRFYRVLVAE